MTAKSERSRIARGAEIERIRTLRGMSLDRLAANAGVHLRTLNRMIGGNPVYVENIAAVAKALGVPSESLYEGVAPVAFSPVAPPGKPFSINMTISGTVPGANNLGVLAELTPEVVAKLAAAGITVTSYDAKLAVADRAGDPFQRVIMVIYGLLNTGGPFWCVAAIKPSKQSALIELVQTQAFDMYKQLDGTGHSNESSFGEVVVSGPGKMPPPEVISKVAEIYLIESKILTKSLALPPTVGVAFPT